MRTYTNNLVSTYISCPNMAFQHICEAVDKTRRSYQWAIYYPTPQPMEPEMSQEWLEEEADIIFEMENEDAECCYDGSCIICTEGDNS